MILCLSLSFTITSKANLTDENLRKYVTYCEMEELGKHEADLALAQCLKECSTDWYQKPSVLIPSAALIFLAGFLANK